MTIRRTILGAAALCAATLCAGLPVGATSPPSVPPVSTPAESESAPAADAGVPDPADGIVHSWALGPAGTDENGGNRSSLSYSMAPGTSIEDAVTLYNFGNQDLPFRVYATDAFNNETGDFTLLNGDDVPRDAGAWIDLELEQLIVPAGKQVTIPFTLTVPEGAVPGDHAGAVLASSPTLGYGPNREVLEFDRRTGSRLYVRVAGPVEPQLSVENLSVDYSNSANPLGGSATVSYRIENRGNVRLSGTALASVAGPFGLAKQSAPDDEFVELLPGEGFNTTVEFDGVPALVALSAEVELDDVRQADGVEVDPVARSTTGLALPITVLLALLLLVFATLAWRAARRHRNRVEVVVPADDDQRELQHT